MPEPPALPDEVLEFGARLLGSPVSTYLGTHGPWRTFGAVVEAMRGKGWRWRGEGWMDAIHSIAFVRPEHAHEKPRGYGQHDHPNPAAAALLAAHAALKGEA